MWHRAINKTIPAQRPSLTTKSWPHWKTQSEQRLTKKIKIKNKTEQLSLWTCMQTSYISMSSMNPEFRESWLDSLSVDYLGVISQRYRLRPQGMGHLHHRVHLARTKAAGEDAAVGPGHLQHRHLVASWPPQGLKNKSTRRHSEHKAASSLLTPAVTQAEVRDWLHLAQVPRASVDDAGVSPTSPGEGRDCGPPGERAKLGARDDPQPVVGRALVRVHTLLFPSMWTSLVRQVCLRCFSIIWILLILKSNTGCWL